MTVRTKSAAGAWGGALAAALAFAVSSNAVLAQVAPTATVAPTREAEIAREAYSYLYPLVVMDVTRRQATQKGATAMGAPVNTFHHNQAFPPGDFRAVVRPNFDTLYSSAWLDLADGPILLTIGNTQRRYYMLPLYDMWTDTFAVPGSETLAPEGGRFAVVAPGWKGTLPKGVERIDSPTRYVWIIGRVQTNGPADYPFVHKIQQAFALAPLNPGAKGPARAADVPVPADKSPVAIVNAMSAAEFYETAMRLMVDNPPHFNDQPQLARLGMVGLRAGQGFRFVGLAPSVQQALTQAKTQGPANLLRYAAQGGKQYGGWRTMTTSIGSYGVDYDQRAAVALIGLGANHPVDAIYPRAAADKDGKPLDGANRYVVHFKAGQLPPVRAFWSLTAYNKESYTDPNAIDRYAIGDRDKLTFNTDGSLDLYLQADDPGADKRSNWLPVPRGPFDMNLRLYSPKPEALSGDWPMPVVERLP